MGKVDNYFQARDRGIAWLLKQQDTDGSIAKHLGIGCYYRAPWAFAVTGYDKAALRLVEWIRNHMFAANGDFVGDFSRGGYEKNYYAYPNANLIYGAHILRQFDLSYGGMRFMLTLQDAENGGFFNRCDEMGPTGKQEIWNTCQAGLTCLVTGHLSAAQKVGAFLKKMWEAQPEPETKLYRMFTPTQGLITDLSSLPVGEVGEYVVDATGRRQAYFVPGIAAAFLARLYMATGLDEHLALAESYIQFAMRCSDDQFMRPQVGKVGWGASLLYEITKKYEYRDLAFRVGDYLLDNQFPEGYWLNVHPAIEYHNVLEVTFEFVVHMDTIGTALTAW